ncbi:hypothetical protein SDC9_139926 [bioreactor metagenome]|uniref:Uncharacterized protein n=1 Tax=bioreactor metagenome TaxID=1076179 RepID=A0A645DTH6_9ZZZZ
MVATEAPASLLPRPLTTPLSLPGSNGSNVYPFTGFTVSIWEFSISRGNPWSKDGALAIRLLPTLLTTAPPAARYSCNISHLSDSSPEKEERGIILRKRSTACWVMASIADLYFIKRVPILFDRLDACLITTSETEWSKA